MSRRVCLISTGQPSTNPRLVKEADALVSAGYEVVVIGSFSADWAMDADTRLLATKRWPLTLVDWRRTTAPARYHQTRMRHYLARVAGRSARVPLAVAAAATSRVAPDLRRAALAERADLYIAHNLGALPAAVAAARAHGTRAAFDAEDFHAGQWPAGTPMRALTAQVERACLPACAYVTAAAPGIAEAYAPLWAQGRPQVVLNVFPRADRPAMPRVAAPSDPVTLYWCSQTIGPDRGLEDVVRALAVLPHGAVQLHLRGMWATGYERTLRGLASTLGLPANAIQVHGMADPQDMVRLAWRHDIGLSLETGTTDNSRILLSNKMFTCLLAGLAVVGTSTMGQTAAFEQFGEAGRCYPPGDHEALARLLSTWINDRASLAAARAAAWSLGETRFNWDIEQHTFLSVVERVGAT